MNKEDRSHFDANWYDLWMKQNKAFFESAEKNLKEMFESNEFAHPEEHLKQINAWLDTLKHQWDFSQLTKEQKVYQEYWKNMAALCTEASEKMVQEWMKRGSEHHPIKNINELYELWLHCCQNAFQQSLQKKAYQEAYSDFMNSALKIWKSTVVDK